MSPRTLRAKRLTLLALGLVPLSAASQACSGNAEPGASTAALSSPPPTSSIPRGIMRVQRPGEAATVPLHTDLGAASSDHLTYYGGRVVSNIQVVAVYWTGSVSSTITSGMGAFYQAATNSAWIDWLTEYNTDTGVSPNTDQLIGRGAYVNGYTITPTVNTTTTVADSDIQSEIGVQIAAGHLPAPTKDSGGNDNTYYAVFFPESYTIDGPSGSGTSCVQFCAYHGTISDANGYGEVYYGVHPDVTSGPCDGICGASTTVFNNQTSVASHELAETITDCEVGLATNYAPPLAWYDSTPNTGEIGDICNAQEGTLPGTTYTVQKLFSNSQGACIVSEGAVTPDFSIAASVPSLDLLKNAQTTFTVTSSATKGSPEGIALSASGQPSGVTITFSPSTIFSGGSSTATLVAAADAHAKTYDITVTGTASTGSHTAPLSLDVSHRLENGGFEQGSFDWWYPAGPATAVVDTGCHTGTYCAELGSSTTTSGISSISQGFIAPAGKTELVFWYAATCSTFASDDWIKATLEDEDDATTTTLLYHECETTKWKKVTSPVTAGVKYKLKFESRSDGNASTPSSVLLDGIGLH